MGGPLVPPTRAPQAQPLLQRPQELLLGLPVPLAVPTDAPHKLLRADPSQPKPWARYGHAKDLLRVSSRATRKVVQHDIVFVCMAEQDACGVISRAMQCNVGNVTARKGIMQQCTLRLQIGNSWAWRGPCTCRGALDSLRMSSREAELWRDSPRLCPARCRSRAASTAAYSPAVSARPCCSLHQPGSNRSICGRLPLLTVQHGLQQL